MKKKVLPIIIICAIIVIGTLGIRYPLLGSMGLVGVGIGWMTSQGVASLGIGAIYLRRLLIARSEALKQQL